MGSFRIAAMVLILLNGSLGAEVPEEPTASLLQTSQAQVLQAGSQAETETPPAEELLQLEAETETPPAQAATETPPAQAATETPPAQAAPQAAPQTPPAQEAQLSAPSDGHSSHSASEMPVPVSPPADSQPSPAAQAAPAQPVLASTASAVKSKVATNATALAFGQLTSLDTEFKSLHADDASHVRQLTYNVHLREELQNKLRQAAEQLAEDNEQLAQRTMQIIAGGEVEAHTDDSQAHPAESPAGNGNNETFAALLLEAAVISRRNRELNNAQIAAQALDRVKALVDDISALKARDEQEIQALRVNAQSRNDLHKKIEERSDQLHQDTSMLMKDLGQIRDLVAKDDVLSSESSSTSAGSTSEAVPAVTKQEAFQSEAAAMN